MKGSEPRQNPVFDYRTLRLMVGLVAFTLPLFAVFLSSRPIPSISASYHTESRDIFVGLTFVIGALFFAYNGHDFTQKMVSKGAALAAIITATFPTACDTCQSGLISTIHYIAAVILFVTIAYFCLFPFRLSAIGKPGKEARRRANIYLLCGLIIAASLVFAAIAQFIWSDADRKALALTYWVEFVSLWAFGVAWIVAGQAIPVLANARERLRFSLR